MKILTMILVLGIVLSASFTGCARAEFEVTSLNISPAGLAGGESATVTANIGNVGGSEGIYSAVLKIDGAVVETKRIVVAAGATETVSFTVSLDTAGTYEIALDSAIGTLEVWPDAIEIVGYAQESMQEVKTYQADMTMIMNMSFEGDGEVEEMNVQIDFELAVDNEAEEMEAIMTTVMEVPDEETEQGTIEKYILGDTVYTRMEAPGELVGWQREGLTPGTWESLQLTQQQLDILESAEVNLMGTEKVDGTDCYILEVTPTQETALEAMLSQLQFSQQTDVDPSEISEISEIAEIMNISAKQWVARDTYLLKKAEMTANFSLFGVSMEIAFNLTVGNYNEPVSIVLPPEALEAEDFIGRGEQDAAETELANIQNAVIAMMVDNGIAYLPNPVTVATNDMSAFPDTSVCGVDKINDSAGNAYINGQDKDGYILYLLDRTGDSAQTGLVNYVASQYTTGTYAVDRYGTVTQVTTGYE